MATYVLVHGGGRGGWCTSTIPTRDPEVMAKARSEGRLWGIDTGHDLMITEPRAVADALREVAER